MRRSIMTPLVLLALALASFSSAQVQIGGNVFDGSGGPLLAGTTYQVVGNLVVPLGETLTVAGGAIVKMAGTTVFVYGTLLVNGSASNPAVFTSIEDNSVGVPIGSGNPAPGNWRRMHFHGDSDASVISGAELRWAGLFSPAAIVLEDADVTLDACTVWGCSSDGLDLGGSSYPSVANCTFDGGGGIAVDAAPLGALPGLVANTAAGNTQGDYLRVTVGTFAGNLAFGPAAGMNGTGVVVMAVNVSVGAGQTLDISAGTIIKWQGGVGATLVVDGVLNCWGTSQDPVIFTVFADDTAGGDTNNDGIATSPAPGSWRRIAFGPASDASILHHTELRYGGLFSNAAADLQAADITLNGCVISHCTSDGLNGDNDSFPTVSGCAFHDCGGIPIDEFSLGALPGFSGNVASGSAQGDYFRVTLGTFSGNLAIGPAAGLNGTGVVVIPVNVVIGAGQVLDVAAGTIVKWQAGVIPTLDVDGTLNCGGTAQDPVIFTVFADDTAGGDTNGDGAASAPMPGSWRRADFSDLSDASVLQHTEFRYAGQFSTATVELDAADVTLDSCVIAHGSTAGIMGNENSFPVLSDCAIEDCAQVAATLFSLGALGGFEDNTATGNGGDYVQITDDHIEGYLTITGRSGMNGSGVIVVSTNIVVPFPKTLDILPGTIIKFTADHIVQVAGTLSAFGTGYDPVVITSLADDACGGDTNGDGNATAPAPGSWRRVWYQPGSSGLVRELRLRHGGLFSSASFECESPLVAVFGMRVAHSSTGGIRIAALDGDLVNCVAWSCASHGIYLASGNAGVIHGTLAGNGGTGIWSAGGHSGLAINTIAWGNAGGNFNGFAAGQLAHCDGDPSSAGTGGNIDQDPLFSDPGSGDLTLLASSPALNAGNALVGLAVITDAVDASRLLDWDLSGTDAPDMGAYELGAWTMGVTGEPRTGTTISFGVQGPAGTAIYALGFLDGPELYVQPYGFVTIGDLANITIIGIQPVGTAVTFQLPPPDPFWEKKPFAIQALVIPASGAPVGNITQRYADLLFN